MSNRKIIKFIEPWSGYGPGEVAGFPPEKADQLIGAGLAVEHGKGKAAKPAVKKPAGKPDGGGGPTPNPSTDPDPNPDPDNDPDADPDADPDDEKP